MIDYQCRRRLVLGQQGVIIKATLRDRCPCPNVLVAEYTSYKCFKEVHSAGGFREEASQRGACGWTAKATVYSWPSTGMCDKY